MQLTQIRKRLSDRKSLAIKKRLTVLDERSSIMSFLNQLASDDPRESFYDQQPQQQYQQQYPPQQQQQYSPQQQYQQQNNQQPQYEQQYSPQQFQQPQQQPPQQYQSNQQFQLPPGQNSFGKSIISALVNINQAIQDIPEDELVEDVERYNYETKFASRLEGELLKQVGLFNWISL